jgi:Arf-GAP/SH3 domain/ANK repeat/PH domain-containing protein
VYVINVFIFVVCSLYISYFQDGLKTIEHFGSYVADLSIKLQKIRQKQDEERRRLTELRTLLRSAPGLDKEVSR